jgi:hypothetical protein
LSVGSVLFKVYIVGDQIRVAQRFSLSDVQEGEDICSGVIPFQSADRKEHELIEKT